MDSQENLRLAHQFIEKLRSGARPYEIASLCTSDLDWNIPGDSDALPWIGPKTGREAISDFVRDTRTLIESVSVEIKDVLASDDRAVILGQLQSRINVTGKLIDSAFAIVLTFSGPKVATFLMLEDSFAVSRAAQH